MKNIQYARVYGRFSSKPQERGDSKRRQIEDAKEYAAKNGYTIVGNYFDEGVSGKDGLNLEREFGRLLKEAKEGETVLVEFLDRIGRQNPFILGKLILDTVERGISIIAYKESKVITKDNIQNIDTQFSVFTGAAVGHADNKRKSDRLVKTTNDAYRNAAKGIFSGTIRKYLPECYRWNENTKVLDFDEDLAKVIRRIFQMYAEGIGVTTIAKTLNIEKVPTIYKTQNHQVIGTRKPWMEASIKKILRNESYAGVLHVKDMKFKGIPAVIDRATWDRVSLMIKRNTQRRGNLTGRINNLFAGIGLCKHCGGTVNVNVCLPKKAKNNTIYYYRCKNARLGVCTQPHKMLNAKLVELGFFGHFFGGSPEKEFKSQKTALLEQAQAIKLRIEKMDSAISNLYDLVESGDSEAKSRLVKRKAEKAALEESLNEVAGSMVEDSAVPSLMDEIKELMDYGDEKPGDDEKARELIAEFYPKLEKKLADLETRKKLVNTLPTLFSKIVFDCIKGTVQPFKKDGESLPRLDLDSVEL